MRLKGRLFRGAVGVVFMLAGLALVVRPGGAHFSMGGFLLGLVLVVAGFTLLTGRKIRW